MAEHSSPGDPGALLRQSEERYRALFETVDEGFCVVEVLFDDRDRPVDYRFVEANPAFDSELRFREMADQAPAMLWVTDAAHAATYLSRGWYEYTGQSVEEALGMGWTLAVHADDREASARAFLDAAERREPFRVEHRLRTRSGAYRWVLDTGRPRNSPDGAFLGYIGSVIDIHERRLAEEALREADRRKSEFLGVLSHDHNAAKFAQPEDVARAVQAGFDGHIAKPPDAAELEQVLAEPPRRAPR